MNKGKTPYHLLDFRFMAAVAERMAEGLQTDGRTVNGWKKLPPTSENIDQYFSAALRHLVAGVEQWEPDNLAAVAANAMILWDMVQRADAEGAEEDGLCVGDVVAFAKQLRNGLDAFKRACGIPAAEVLQEDEELDAAREEMLAGKWPRKTGEELAADIERWTKKPPEMCSIDESGAEPIVYSHCVRCNAVITNTKTNVCEVCEAALQAAKRKAPARTVAEIRAEIEAKNNGGHYGNSI